MAAAAVYGFKNNPKDDVAADTKVTGPGGVVLTERGVGAVGGLLLGCRSEPAQLHGGVAGSWHHGSLSGSTHDGGGAFDLRVNKIPEDRLESLVVALRVRCGGPAWARTEKHGWTKGDHIHVIVRDEADLSSGAKWQVSEYDAGRNGLSGGGPDYHARPAWVPFVYPPMKDKIELEDEDVFIFKTHANADPKGVPGRGAAFIVFNGKAVQCDKDYTASPDVPVIASPPRRWTTPSTRLSRSSASSTNTQAAPSCEWGTQDSRRAPHVHRDGWKGGGRSGTSGWRRTR